MSVQSRLLVWEAPWGPSSHGLTWRLSCKSEQSVKLMITLLTVRAPLNATASIWVAYTLYLLWHATNPTSAHPPTMTGGVLHHLQQGQQWFSCALLLPILVLLHVLPLFLHGYLGNRHTQVLCNSCLHALQVWAVEIERTVSACF